MASTEEFIEFVCSQIDNEGVIRYRKMFGDYMVYINDKPLLLVCDNVVYVKILKPLEPVLEEADTGYPYRGARLHYILDIEDRLLVRTVIDLLEPITAVPVKRRRKGRGHQ
ncbi:TfoX/Sxy family protein [Sphaerochaeta sp.]|uniref:TfoX/Sxy family protein n=1 Tax=Sphaerochaeta sp. TaxID=1972642 RepID=UPI002FC91582